MSRGLMLLGAVWQEFHCLDSSQPYRISASPHLSSVNQSMSACTALSPFMICGIKRARLCLQAVETNTYCVWLLKVKRACSATQPAFCSQLGGLAHSKLNESENGPAALFPWPYGVPAIRAGEGAAAWTGLIINSKEKYIGRGITLG